MSLGSRYAFYGCSLSVTSKCLIALSLSSCALQDLQVCSSNMLLRALVVSTCAFQVCSACVLFQLIFCVCSISVLCKSAFYMCSLGGCSATCSSGPSSLHNLPAPHLWTWSFKPSQAQFGRSLSGYMCLSLSLKGNAFSRLSDCHPRAHVKFQEAPSFFPSQHRQMIGKGSHSPWNTSTRHMFLTTHHLDRVFETH